MKTINLFTLVFLLFSYTILFAANPILAKEKTPSTNKAVHHAQETDVKIQANPVTPCGSALENTATPKTGLIIDDSIKAMAPVTPKEASFDDGVYDDTSDITTLSPSTPSEATFE